MRSFPAAALIGLGFLAGTTFGVDCTGGSGAAVAEQPIASRDSTDILVKLGVLEERLKAHGQALDNYLKDKADLERQQAALAEWNKAQQVRDWPEKPKAKGKRR
jgi:hypothetical protein